MLIKQELVDGLKKLGIKQGMMIEVHASMKSFGYIVGGAQTLVDALIECIGYNGTLLMPLHFRDNTEPSSWSSPQVEPEMIGKVRQSLPLPNKKESETYQLGKVVENLRRRDGVVFSEHPNTAYVAWGKYAKLLCNHHSLHFALSSESPCARLNELRGSILLLGVDYDKATAMHLSEYYSGVRPVIISGAMQQTDGYRQFQSYLDVANDASDFIEVGQALERKGFVQIETIGNAPCRLFQASVAIDYATKYLKQKSVLQYYRGN